MEIGRGFLRGTYCSMGRRESNLSGLYSIKRSEKLEIHSKKRQDRDFYFSRAYNSLRKINNK